MRLEVMKRFGRRTPNKSLNPSSVLSFSSNADRAPQLEAGVRPLTDAHVNAEIAEANRRGHSSNLGVIPFLCLHRRYEREHPHCRPYEHVAASSLGLPRPR